jgi:glycosyltransferase involved in cell wall biosynthesis
MTKSAIIAYVISRLRGVPLVTCVQNSFSKFAGIMKVGDRVITGCKVVADDMVKRGVPQAKLRPILNGTIGSVRQEQSLEADEPVTFQHPAVVTFAGMHWRKGIPDLIVGFELARKSNPDLHLYLFGEGPNLEEYKALVSPDNESNITFCDPVPNAKPYLQAADVFVLASVADPAPLVICEAREAGCAVIATRVDGIPELLEEGRAGILVKAKAPEEIAEKLIYLFADPANLANWRQNGQYRIERLKVSRVATESVAVYGEVIRPNARRAIARGCRSG